jgi:hypothetical protein
MDHERKDWTFLNGLFCLLLILVVSTKEMKLAQTPNLRYQYIFRSS